MLNDAWRDVFDCAVVVSNDSDLAEACHLVKSMGKTVGILCAPKRPTKQLQLCSHFHRRITRTHLQNSQMPETMKDQAGRTITRPVRWR
jgi:uncharacterized LabA/DUF88 family protein